MAGRKILFIVNPISGHGAAKKFFQKINLKKIYPDDETKIVISEYPQHATALAKEGAENGFNIIASAGGDGTVNEVGKAIMHTDVQLAIIPFGSGNGLARHCKIPIKSLQALHLINRGKTAVIDAGTLDGNPFFCAAGIGFDAHVGALFSKAGTRGLSTYLRISVVEYFSYHCPDFTIKADEKEFRVNSFVLTFANANQFGNNAYIAPGASLTDNLLDLCILRSFPFAMAPVLAVRLFRGTIESSHYYQRIRGRHFTISRTASGFAHTDGEVFETGSEIEVKTIPSCLHIITGN